MGGDVGTGDDATAQHGPQGAFAGAHAAVGAGTALPVAGHYNSDSDNAIQKIVFGAEL